MYKFGRHTKRLLIAIVGGCVVLIGIVAIPYPGPGWLIVFTGFAILATEFSWAQRVLDYLRKRYEGWLAWLKRQGVAMRLFVAGTTVLATIATVWLLNGYGVMNDWFDLQQPWLYSPLSK